MKDEQELEKTYQSVTDLVAVHLMANIFLSNQEEEAADTDLGQHQSDSFDYDDLANHQSEEPLSLGGKTVNPGLAWKLAQVIKTFFRLRRD